jgi:FkbM family methyltransferase
MSRVKHAYFLLNKKLFSIRILFGLSKLSKKRIVLAEFQVKSSNSTRSITLVNDKVILPNMARYGVWDQPTTDFFARKIRSHSDGGNSVFIDIGANQGLISRQINDSLNQLGFDDENLHYELIEPNPLYLYAAIRNTSDFERARYLNYALVDDNQEQMEQVQDSTLYFTSYNASATLMPDTLYNMTGMINNPSTIPINTKSCSAYVQEFMNRFPSSKIFMKSDTDGNCLKILREMGNQKEFFRLVKAFEIEINFELELQDPEKRSFILDLVSKYSEVSLLFKNASHTGDNAIEILRSRTTGAANLQCSI